MVGFQGDFLYAESFGSSISRIPLFRGDSQITRNYCAFWKQENTGKYVEEFADILKREFDQIYLMERVVLIFGRAVLFRISFTYENLLKVKLIPRRTFIIINTGRMKEKGFVLRAVM